MLTYRNISAWEEHNFLFFKGLLLTGTSTDLTLIFWEKSNKLKALFSTVREIRLFYIKGDLNSEALNHCLKSQSLFKNPNQVSNCHYLTLRVASHWFSNWTLKCKCEVSMNARKEAGPELKSSWRV